MVREVEPFETIRYWGNRFAELCNEHLAGAPTQQEVTEIADRLYPTGDACEAGHVVTMDGVLGILLEWEFEDGYVPSPLITEWWRQEQLGTGRPLAYSGYGSFDDRWQFAVFIPAEGATRELVEEWGKRMIAWGERA